MDYENPNDGKPANELAAPVAQAAPETTEPSEATKNFVTEWTKRIAAAKKHYEPVFKKMRTCMHIAKAGDSKDWVGSEEDNGRYVVPVVKRHINQSVAQLYAKNPKSYAERKRRRMHSVWDGKLSTLQEAAQMAQMSAQSGELDPNAVAILQDATAVQKYVKMMDGLADTLNILHEYYMNEQSSGYKQQFKALVRRAKVTGVGYVTLGMQRLLAPRPDWQASIEDCTRQMALVEQRLAAASRDEYEEDSARLEELKHMLAELQSKEFIIAREGPVLGFPKSTRIIIDPCCQHLKTLAGANWWVEEFEGMSADAIEATYGKQVASKAKKYTPERARWSDKKGESVKEDCYLVWKVQDKRTGLEFTICEGYDDYLKPPAAPDVKIERFFTLFPLVFNEIEDEDDLFPPSDVWDARHTQREYNTARQGLREHRRQNKPGYYSPTDSLGESDKKKLAARESGDIVEVAALATGEKLQDKLGAIPTIPIDAAVYDVEPLYGDMLRIVGGQAASQGTTKGETATETSIAENSRQVAESSNVDDLDDLLTELARSMGQLMLAELSLETVQEIVGPGAVWSEFSREEIGKDLMLSIRAGSSGRPNKAADLANMERGMPFIVQLPGVNPTPFAQRYLDLLDIDVENGVVEGMPSITALNAMMTAAGKQPQAGTGDPQSDPNAQGAKGGDNGAKPAQDEPNSQPQYTAPGEATPAPA